MSHLVREPVKNTLPVHIIMKLQPGLPSLRGKEEYRVLLNCFTMGKERFGFRLNHYSVQSNHLHLIVEADDRRALSRGMQGLSIRIAKRLNKLWQRSGAVLRDRYKDVILRCPRQMRNALAYVLKNSRRHRCEVEPFDLYSSSKAFTGWKKTFMLPEHEQGMPPVVEARSWLQTVGWKRGGGPIPCNTIPGPASQAPRVGAA